MRTSLRPFNRCLAAALLSGAALLAATAQAQAATLKPVGKSSAPRVKTLPVISGTAQEGQTLTASTGSWFGRPTSYAYQWLRCDSAGSNCTAVAGATARTYALGAGDVGSTMRVRVTARNAYGSASATSARTAVVTAAAVADPTPAPPPSSTPGEPAPIAGQGYSMVWGQEFDGPLDPNTWRLGAWWRPYTPTAEEVYVSNGTLKLATKRKYNYRDVTVSTDPTQALTKAWQEGYFEARVRMTSGKGTWPAFWLISSTHRWNPIYPTPACGQPTCLASEIDIFEGQGTHPTGFWGTIHRSSASAYGPDQINSNNYQNVGTNLYDSWHKLSAKWTASTVSWYLDDVLVHSASTFDSTPQPHFMLLTSQVGGWESGNTPDATTPDDLIMEYDWVRVWQR